MLFLWLLEAKRSCKAEGRISLQPHCDFIKCQVFIIEEIIDVCFPFLPSHILSPRQYPGCLLFQLQCNHSKTVIAAGSFPNPSNRVLFFSFAKLNTSIVRGSPPGAVAPACGWEESLSHMKGAWRLCRPGKPPLRVYVLTDSFCLGVNLPKWCLPAHAWSKDGFKNVSQPPKSHLNS